jgi:Leucine-rich repeat (LRR) protein
LKELDLAVNSLEYLPESVRKLSQLKELDLSLNKLKNLSKTLLPILDGLDNLKELRLDKSQLKELKEAGILKNYNFWYYYIENYKRLLIPKPLSD